MKQLLTIMFLYLVLSKVCWSQFNASNAPNSTATVSAESVTAAVALGNVTVNPSNGAGKFDLIGAQPDQVVSVVCQYPQGNAAHPVQIALLDGGHLVSVPQNTATGGDGSLKFQVQLGHDVGLYRVTLRDGQRLLLLKFWVLDSQNPQRNPACITAANPGF